MSQNNKLFVGGISYQFDEDNLREQLTELFAQYGTVEKVEIPVDKMNNNSIKGFAFVTMSSDEEAQKAMDELNGHDLEGRQMRIDIAKPPAPRDDRRSGGYSNNNRGGGSRRSNNDW